MPQPFLIPFPEDAEFKKVPSFISNINLDFKEGKVTYSNDDTATDLINSLDNYEGKSTGIDLYIRSVAVYVGCPFSIYFETASKQKFFFKAGWHIFNNLEIEKLTISLATAMTPDEALLKVIGSTSETMPYDPRVTDVFDELTFDSYTTANSYTFKISRYTENMNRHIFQIEETGGSNAVMYRVRGRLKGNSAYKTLIDGEIVQAGSISITEIEGYFDWIICEIKSAVSGSAGTAEGDYRSFRE
jgi:hypothetical protein